MNYFIHADRFYMPDRIQYGGYLEVEGGRFGFWQQDKPRGAEIIDYAGAWVAPGLFDTHVHGYKGYDVMDADPEGLKQMSEGILENGVTSFLPTPLTAPAEEIEAACKSVADHAAECRGAKVRGIFIEGPFFTAEHKGAQNEAYLLPPSVELVEKWQEAAHGMIKKIAIAPEYEGAVEFTKAVTREGIHVALGHSNATYAEARACVDAGANIFVHTYNGMRGLHHREPGILGCDLVSDDAYGEMICDGIHLTPQAVDVVIRCKGDKAMLITDCLRAGGMPDGEYVLGEMKFRVVKGAAHLVESGNLAGSTLRLIDGVKHVVEWGLVDPAQGIKMASQYPAESLDMEKVTGSLKAGLEADYIVLSPDFEVQATYIDGEKRFER